MWTSLTGWKVGQLAGANGTATLPAGAVIVLVIAHASAGGATCSILGGPNVTVVSGAQPLYIQNYHALMQANSVSSTIVFTGTDMYYVQFVTAGNV
jgi:hypothetical protein